MDIQILYRDRDLLVCIKPAGVATQTARLTQPDMVSLLRNQLTREGEPSELHVVHRLDQPVEGILVFARNSRTAARLDRQAADTTGQGMCKEYLAEVEGTFREVEGRLEHPLIRDGRTNLSRVAQETDFKDPSKKKLIKQASLQYETVELREDQRSLLRIHLETGRHHQIRVQLSHEGHPLVGDGKYGNGKRGEQLRLCACRLEFTMPDRTRKTFEIQPTWM